MGLHNWMDGDRSIRNGVALWSAVDTEALAPADRGEAIRAIPKRSPSDLSDELCKVLHLPAFRLLSGLPLLA